MITQCPSWRTGTFGIHIMINYNSKIWIMLRGAWCRLTNTMYTDLISLFIGKRSSTHKYTNLGNLIHVNLYSICLKMCGSHFPEAPIYRNVTYAKSTLRYILQTGTLGLILYFVYHITVHHAFPSMFFVAFYCAFDTCFFLC